MAKSDKSSEAKALRFARRFDIVCIFGFLPNQRFDLTIFPKVVDIGARVRVSRVVSSSLLIRMVAIVDLLTYRFCSFHRSF